MGKKRSRKEKKEFIKRFQSLVDQTATYLRESTDEFIAILEEAPIEEHEQISKEFKEKTTRELDAIFEEAHKKEEEARKVAEAKKQKSWWQRFKARLGI